MRVHLWAFGAPSDPWVSEGEKLYIKRIERYMPFEYKCQLITKSRNAEQVLAAEGKWLLQQIENTPSKIILLDEKGPQLTSVQFSKKLGQWREGSHKRVVFLIGSAYGFDHTVYKSAHEILGLSMMTMPHQLCRLLFLEQIYRACTILRGESYHHD